MAVKFNDTTMKGALFGAAFDQQTDIGYFDRDADGQMQFTCVVNRVFKKTGEHTELSGLMTLCRDGKLITVRHVSKPGSDLLADYREVSIWERAPAPAPTPLVLGGDAATVYKDL